MMTKKLRFILYSLLLFSMLTFTGCKKDSETTPTGLQPSITSVTPTEGAISTELAIEGTNFETGASVFVGDVESTVVDVVSKTQIFAQVPSGIIANQGLSVRVRNPGGLESTLESVFTAISPILDFVNSATKPSGNQGSTAIFEGRAFGSIQGTSKIYFSDGIGGKIEAIVASADDWTDEFIVTTVPSGAEDGPVYVETELGASNEVEFNVTDQAVFSPSAINWTVTTALPEVVSGHNAISATIDNGTNEMQYVFVTGGKDDLGSALDQVLVGEIGSDGTIASWTVTTSLPSATAFHKTIAATPFNSKVGASGYLYVFGGVDNNDDVINTVSVAAFNNDGTIGMWSTSTSLPEPLHSMGAVIFRSTIYIAGGSTTGDVPVSKVYKAKIDETGSLGQWSELTELPSARSYHGFVTFGGYLYTVGGDAGTIAPDTGTNSSALTEVVFARISLRTGDITETGWTLNANELQKSRGKHTTLVVGGNMFVSSGLYAAASQGSSENTFAQILADGTVDSFGGATGSNTLLSEGGSNLFNQAGLSYIDANGVAHVMILGGDDVNDPGTKVGNVLFY
jgi:N-acetylneuraminic acid mutarotase